MQVRLLMKMLLQLSLACSCHGSCLRLCRCSVLCLLRMLLLCDLQTANQPELIAPAQLWKRNCGWFGFELAASSMVLVDMFGSPSISSTVTVTFGHHIKHHHRGSVFCVDGCCPPNGCAHAAWSSSRIQLKPGMLCLYLAGDVFSCPGLQCLLPLVFHLCCTCSHLVLPGLCGCCLLCLQRQPLCLM